MQNHVHQSSKIYQIVFIFASLWIEASCGPFLDYCKEIPYNLIAKCNITCDTCQAQQSSCDSCPSYLYYNQSQCFIPSEQKITYTEYFFDANLKSDSQFGIFQTEEGLLTSGEVFRLCIANNYKFDVIGLFRSFDQLSFTQNYAFQSSQIALNFRLFFTTEIAIVKVYVNQKVLYNLTLDSGFTLNLTETETSEVDSDDIHWNIGIISTDPSAYIDQVFAPIKTGMLPLNHKVAAIKITVQSGTLNFDNNTQKFWGIRDLSVVTVRCGTCVTDQLKRLAEALGIVIGISSGLIIILIFILYIYSKIKKANYRKKLQKRFKESQQRIIASERNL